MQTCSLAYMHTRIHAYMHVCIYAYIQTCKHANIHAYKYKNIQTSIHTDLQTYTQTDIPMLLVIAGTNTPRASLPLGPWLFVTEAPERHRKDTEEISPVSPNHSPRLSFRKPNSDPPVLSFPGGV